MLEVKKISGQRGERHLFSNLTFTLAQREVLHIQGKNGVGKTTLLRMLCGLARPQSGEILWDGTKISENLLEYFQSLIYIGHETGIKEDLTALENLSFINVLYGSQTSKSIEEILQIFQISQFSNVQCRHLSAGQKRRVGLARLLLSNARLWLLDEPFTALDSNAQNTVLSVLAAHLENGGMCAVTSHQPIVFSESKVRQIVLEKT